MLLALVEGLALRAEERVGVPDDVLHRIGYPFGGLGTTATLFLVTGVVLLLLPSVLDQEATYGQERMAGAALVASNVLAILMAMGSVLAVRANLHEHQAKGIAIPSYARV